MNNGGPAFPNPEVRDRDGNGITEGSAGLSVRDWFAGQALAGWLASIAEDQMHPAYYDEAESPEAATAGAACIARLSYVMADAMLKARE